MEKRRFFLLALLILMLTDFCYSQQNNIVSGIVRSVNNEPLIGVSVILKGTTTGTVTDMNGKYSVSAPRNGRLIFEYLGMVKQEIVITGTTLDVIMEEDSQSLDEVVVVGYGTVKKSDLTGAVSSVKTQDLKTMATSGIIGAIQGRVAGVNVQSSSGEPGEGMQVRIRGIGTINNSDPLYVIDGFPGANMSYLQPGDIESMEILKDASATAIYGSRGANGVILIKTKSGMKNSLAVNFDAYYGTSEVSKRYDLTNAAEWSRLKLDALTNANKVPSEEDANILNYVIDNNYKGTDWQDEIFRTGIIQNYNLTLNGGSEKNMYDIGLNYSKNEGVVKNTGDQKYAFHINNDYVLSKHVKLGMNLAYVNYERTHDNNGYYTGTIAWALYSDPITPAWDYTTNNYGKYYYSGQTNPAVTIDDNANRKTYSNNFSGRGYLQLDDIFVKGLSFRSQFGMDMNFDKYKQYLFAYYIDTDKKRDQSSLLERKSEYKSWINSNVLSYVRTFNKHSVNAMIGMEAQEFKNDYNSITVYNVPNDKNLEYIDAAKDKTSSLATGTPSDNSILSYFTRLNYSYNNRYLLTATWRADGSSKFLGNNKWGYFPSFSLGWNVHEEGFMSGFSTLSQLKLRAGWGQVGNEGSVYNYEYASSVENGYNYAYNTVILNGSTPRVLSNKELKWETVQQTNLAIDLGLFNKLSATLELFDKKTKDMIIAVPIPIYAGIAPANQNFGEMSNKGFEASLNYQDRLACGLGFNIGGNISFIKNEVTKLAGADSFIEGASMDVLGNLTRTSVGNEIAYYYGLQTNGIFHSDAEAEAYKNKNGEKIQPNAKGGDVRFIDLNGDGVINDKDRTKLGSAMPDFSYGINIGLDYKGVDLKLFFQGVQGNQIINTMYYFLHSSNVVESNVSRDMIHAWSPANASSDIPRVVNGDPNQNFRFSDRYMEDGSYLRLRNLQIGYTVPLNISKKVYMQNLRAYFSVDNLFTWTNYSGYDPEVWGYGYYDANTGRNNYSPLQSGIDRANYPVTRKFTVGVNIKF